MNGSRLRILHVLEAIEGGTARHVVDIVRNATGVDHDVVIPAERVGGETDRAAAPAMEAAGATIHHLDMRRDPVRPANAAALGRLVRLIRRQRPDVIHTHSSIGGLLGRLAGTACRLPRLYTPNGVTNVRAGLLVERALGPLTDVFIAVSESEREHVLRLRLVPAGKIEVVPNGIEAEPPALDAAPPDLRAQLGLPAGTPLVGSISRLVWQKAPEDLVAAWATAASRIPEAHFVLIGSGPLQGELDAAIGAAALAPRFHQIASLPAAWSVIDQFDVFSLASRFEGAPYALLEANRAETAIAATDVVGTRDIVEDGVTGLLAPAGDTAGLGDRIAGLLEDPLERATLTTAAKARLLCEFTVNTMGSRLEAIYARATGR